MGNVYIIDSSDEQQWNPRQADTFTVQLTSVAGVRERNKKIIIILKKKPLQLIQKLDLIPIVRVSCSADGHYVLYI